LDVGTTWHINIIDGGEADIAVALTVARMIQERLSSSFEVID
jgi:hypothetical protein